MEFKDLSIFFFFSTMILSNGVDFDFFVDQNCLIWGLKNTRGYESKCKNKNVFVFENQKLVACEYADDFIKTGKSMFLIFIINVLEISAIYV